VGQFYKAKLIAVGEFIMAEEKSGQTKSTTQKIGLILGPVLFFIMILFFNLEPGKPIVTRMAAVALLMAVWWITDAIPLFATALLPMVLYPLLGILTTKATAPIYINSTIFLFMGGFMIALTMEDWNLHKRIALFIIRIIGGGPSRIVLGFMLAGAFLSMWISNTATAIMMVPIGMAIVYQMEAKFNVEETHKFTLGLMLGIAYACSVGGMATLVGTPPNLAFVRIFQISFPKAEPIAFGTWFIMGLPLSAIMLGFIWFFITKVLYRVPAHITVDKSIVDKEYRELGSMSFEERAVMTIFLLTAILWIFRNKLNLGFLSIPGWSQLIPYPKMIDDGTVALFMAMLMFFIPTRSAGAKSPTIMGPEVIKNIPWNIVILFGGGFALAGGFKTTGLSTLIGQKFSDLAGLHPIIIVFIACIGLTFLTEVTSNTATTQMILPILAALSLDMKINPLFLMIPATLSASCAFMLPVATPPNAIIFGSGRVKIAEMAKAGIFINIVGAVFITLFFYFIATAIFSIDASVFPEWAQKLAH
jgi:sodium-dependent dicarboxylate transporter 2/3/5